MTEFTHRSVEDAQKKSSAQILLVTLGLTAVTTNFIVGAALAAAMDQSQWVAAIVLGGVALAIIAGHTAYFSSRTSKSFGGQMTDVFGDVVARLIVGFAALVVLGWYIIQASLLGNVFAGYWPDVPDEFFLFVTPLALAITSFIGFRALAMLSWIAVPIIAVGAVLILTSGGGGGAVSDTKSMPFAAATSLVFSLWITGAIGTVADVMRFERRPARAAFLAALAFSVGNTGLMLVGAFAYEKYGTEDIGGVMQLAGLGLIGVAFLVASIWSTNDNAMYSISLNFNRATGVSARAIIVVAALVAAGASLLRPYELPQLSAWLGLLGGIVPSIGGAIIAARTFDVRLSIPAAVLSVVAGAAVAYTNPLGWGVLLSLPASFVAAAILSQVPGLRTRITEPRT